MDKINSNNKDISNDELGITTVHPPHDMTVSVIDEYDMVLEHSTSVSKPLSTNTHSEADTPISHRDQEVVYPTTHVISVATNKHDPELVRYASNELHDVSLDSTDKKPDPMDNPEQCKCQTSNEQTTNIFNICCNGICNFTMSIWNWLKQQYTKITSTSSVSKKEDEV